MVTTLHGYTNIINNYVWIQDFVHTLTSSTGMFALNVIMFCHQWWFRNDHVKRVIFGASFLATVKISQQSSPLIETPYDIWPLFEAAPRYCPCSCGCEIKSLVPISCPSLLLWPGATYVYLVAQCNLCGCTYHYKALKPPIRRTTSQGCTTCYLGNT